MKCGFIGTPSTFNFDNDIAQGTQHYTKLKENSFYIINDTKRY